MTDNAIIVILSLSLGSILFAIIEVFLSRARRREAAWQRIGATLASDPRYREIFPRTCGVLGIQGPQGTPLPLEYRKPPPSPEYVRPGEEE